ncbi:MAG: aryl-sulfate sulfotransferase [Chitinophagales bacterium]|nr:aryl-sulfate sulfotransferase [Chitinophagales bacterium]
MTLKNFSRIMSLSVALLLCSHSIWAQFQYVNPKPGSSMHHVETGIILRNGALIDPSSLQASLFSVVGSKSGNHAVKIILADDSKTVLLNPIVVFKPGETVTVTVKSGMKTLQGLTITGTTFTFKIGDTGNPETQARIQNALAQIHTEEMGAPPVISRTNSPADWHHALPPFDIWVNNNPAPGQIFFHNFSFFLTGTSHYCIIENNGDSVYGKWDTIKGNNFTLNGNNYLTLYNDTLMAFQVLDSNYNSIDTFQMGNGYKADVHEFLIYSNGHSFLESYDAEPFDMTIYNPTYNPDAIVTGAVVQELDKNKNVIFQWRSWDYFQVTDDTHDPLTTSTIDYVHLNSIYPDTDGNIIVSCRSMDEVTKINHTTGGLVWRWGGKNNQFTFVSDAEKFSHQHDVIRITNGHITMFDNGNYHSPPQSFAKEYQLDEVNKVATLVWKYSRNTSAGPVYGNAMGSMQRLANGNTLISWGLIYVPEFPTATEVDINQNVVWEMRLDDTYTDAIYRIHKFTWDPCSRPTTSTMRATNITATKAQLSWGAATNASSYSLNYRLQGATNWIVKSPSSPNKTVKKLTPGSTYEWRVRSTCTNPSAQSGYTGIKTFNTLAGRDVVLTENKESNVYIYPNPAAGLFTIHFNVDQDGPVQIKIYDITGRIIYFINKDMNVGEQALKVNLDGVTAGMYVAEIRTASGKFTQKLVIE